MSPRGPWVRNNLTSLSHRAPRVLEIPSILSNVLCLPLYLLTISLRNKLLNPSPKLILNQTRQKTQILPHASYVLVNPMQADLLPTTNSVPTFLLPSVFSQNDVARRLPPPLVESAMMAVRGALAPSTKSTYAAGPLRFTQFCDKWGISEEARMPADYALLCAFIGEYKGLQSGNTIRSWLAGLRSWHIMNHAPWHGDDSWVHLARTSANKEGAKHKLALRAPVSIEHLSCLRRALDLSTPFHAAVWAVALVTFFGCRRLGETTLSTAAAFDPKYHVLRSTKILFRVLRDGARSASFDIPWTKSTKEVGATVILTARRDGDPLCPVAAFQNHLHVNSSVPASSTLFAYNSSSGQPKNLLKHEFLNFVTNIWSSAMLAHVLGHSFRIGGAVELLLAGVPPEIVAATGGWTSLAFLLYWRRMDEILPMSTSKAYNQAHLDRLTSILEEFRISHKIPSSLLDNSF